MTARPDDVDPTRATALALNRRAFAGIAAGLAGGVSAGAHALAQGAPFGAPHAPIVAADDPALVIARPALDYVDEATGVARTLDAYAAAPRTHAATACLVVTQAIWGVDAQLRDVVRRFAKAGYATVAPNLYAGLGAPSGDGIADVAAFRAFPAKLVERTVDRDLLAAARWASAWPGTHRRSGAPKIGIVGFCMGGGIALRQTIDQPDVFASAAVFYGSPALALQNAQRIRTAIIGSYGARDTSIAPADVRDLARHLSDQHTPNDFKMYDEAGHAFFDDTRPSYVASAAADSWTRVTSWFDVTLRA